MIDRGKLNILGVLIDAVDYEAAVDRILDAARQSRSMAVSALAVHGVMTGVMDDNHRHRLNRLDLVVPDGQPVRWSLNWLHRAALADRVYGPNLMMEVCRACAAQKISIALLGATEDLLQRLAANLRRQFPDLQIAAAIPSKFRTLQPSEKRQLIEQLKSSGAGVVFVGLGCPRQEIWAYEFKDHLPLPVIAVGAAFNFHAGTLSQAPAWMQRSGLEWLYRLIREPSRLWRRYLLLNPYFAWLIFSQWTGLQRFATDNTKPPQNEVLPG